MGFHRVARRGLPQGRTEDSGKFRTKEVRATAIYNNTSKGKHETVHGQRDSSAICGCVTLFKIYYFSEPHKTQGFYEGQMGWGGARDL